MADQGPVLKPFTPAGGGILESAFRQVRDEYLTVPEGKKVAVAGVFNEDGLAVGAAWVTPHGFELKGDLTLDREDGKLKNPTVRVLMTF